jgi:hypothetical protein
VADRDALLEISLQKTLVEQITVDEKMHAISRLGILRIDIVEPEEDVAGSGETGQDRLHIVCLYSLMRRTN